MRARLGIERRIHPSYLLKKKIRVPFSQRLGLVYVASLTQDRPVG